MNLVCGTLTELKAQLLAEALRVDTAYDAALTAIGKGVGGALEKFCNRKFFRTEGDFFYSGADRDHVYVPRYPLETVSAIHKKTTETDGWTLQSDLVLNTESQSGLVHFGAVQGLWYETLRLTYTGGYWFDEDENGGGTQPAGSAVLPDDLKLAWVLQCKRMWEAYDPLGSQIIPSKETARLVTQGLAGLELIPQVKELLEPFKRYQIT